MTWDPSQYHRFAAERAQPFHDLLDLVEHGDQRPVRVAVDLGCGSGELTVAAAERFDISTTGGSSMVGLDTSESMLAEARALDQSRVRFEHGDLATWTSVGDHDLVLANASLQWVPDHPAVLARWTAALAPGGQLSVQVPANADHPSHLVAVEVAASEPFLSAMGGAPPDDPVAANVLAPERYAEVLHDLGFARQHVRLQVYPHVLESTAAVVEWTRGTSLTRFAGRLPDELRDEFVDTYRRELLRRLGDHSPYLFAFKRILLWAGDPGGAGG